MKIINRRQALLGFSCFLKIGPIKMKLLENYFSGPEEAFWAAASSLERAGLSSPLVSDFIFWRKKFNFDELEEALQKDGINFITWHDSEYPDLLKEISDAPFLLYYRGSLEILRDEQKNRLAIVGSRKHSAYAEKIINELLPTIIRADIEIISGLALGVDMLAHRAALLNKGRTIAVLGSGLDNTSIYPRINRTLAQEIIKNNGVLISEFPPLTPPLRQNFPRRNRIISGLSQATLVVEAKERSGALITAQCALEQNREVMAVPGNIFSEFSAGPNKLIKMGAKLISHVDGVLETFKIEAPNTIQLKPKRSKDPILENNIEKIIYEILKQSHERSEKITTDEIIKISQLDTAIINSTLSMLELRGIAKSDGIGYDIN